MNNKRGLSDVVTTVLIILLAVAAVSALWVLIKPLIDNTTGKVENSLVCQSNTAEIVSCAAGKAGTTIGNHTIVYKLSAIDSSQVKGVSGNIGVIYADGSVNNGAANLDINQVGQLKSTIINGTKSVSKATLTVQFTLTDDKVQACPAVEFTSCSN